jgi:hypothetical protein
MEDATAAALARYVAHGSDLSRPMEMDFFVVVPSEMAGAAVAARVKPLGFVPSVEQDDETHRWTCYCKKTIIPSYDNVVRSEQQLDEIAREHGGHADGFGSFGNALGDGAGK